MLGDGQAKPRAARGPRPRRIDPVEPFEYAVQRRRGDADALVDHANRHGAWVLAQRDAHADRRVFGRVADGVFDEVLHGHGEGLPVDHDGDVALRLVVRGGVSVDRRLLAAQRQPYGDVLRTGLHQVLADGRAHHRHGGYALRLEHRRRVLRALQFDQVGHQFGQPRGLLGDAAGEIPHGARVIRRVGDGFGEQRDRACGGLQLVGDIGDEVAAHPLEPTLLGHVVDEHRVQTVADMADAYAQVAVGGRRAAGGDTSSGNRARHAGQVERDAHLAFPHAPVLHHDVQDVEDLVLDDPAVLDDIDVHLAFAGAPHGTVAVADDHLGRHDVDEPLFRLAHRHVGAEQQAGIAPLSRQRVAFAGLAPQRVRPRYGNHQHDNRHQHRQRHMHPCHRTRPAFPRPCTALIHPHR